MTTELELRIIKIYILILKNLDKTYVETTSLETFRIIIEKISNTNKEIEVDGNKMKLTLHGINNCKIYDPFFI
jgi:hypothetical protein